jgi:hypothetical protein
MKKCKTRLNCIYYRHVYFHRDMANKPASHLTQTWAFLLLHRHSFRRLCWRLKWKIYASGRTPKLSWTPPDSMSSSCGWKSISFQFLSPMNDPIRASSLTDPYIWGKARFHTIFYPLTIFKKIIAKS